MGVKFNREYAEIVNDLAAAIARIPDCHTAIEMDGDDWSKLAEQEQLDTIRTLADDVFFALGADSRMRVGSGKIEYDAVNHLIKVTTDPKLVVIVNLL